MAEIKIDDFKKNLKAFIEEKYSKKVKTLFVDGIKNVILDEENKAAILQVNRILDKDKITSQLSIIAEYFNFYFKNDYKIQVEVVEKKQETAPEKEKEKEKITRKKEDKKSPLNPKYTFTSFVVGDNSQFAYNICLAISRHPAMGYNPCFIYGDSGLGKTHLAQAVGNDIVKNLGLKVSFISCEDFIDEFINYTLDKKINQFKDKFKNVDVLIVDDIQFLEKSEKFQEIFFNIFNVLKDNNKQILCTSDRPIYALKKIQQRLSSRISSGITAELNAPDYETRLAIITSKCKEMNYSLDKEIKDFIAKNVITNVRNIEGCITSLKGYQDLISEKMNLAMAKEVLKNNIIDEDNNDGINSSMIIEQVCKFFNITSSDLLGKKRTKSFVIPRNCAAYLLSILTDMSTTEIGIALGGRDHSSIIYAVKKVRNQTLEDESFKSKIDTITETIKREARL